MKGSSLFVIREQCTNIQLCCHKNINRILELMTKNNKDLNIMKNLEKYTKLCISMEKLCEYVCSSCCNANEVSNNILKEFNLMCNKMKNICNKLKLKLISKYCKYIRLDEMSKLCIINFNKKIKKTKKNLK